VLAATFILVIVWLFVAPLRPAEWATISRGMDRLEVLAHLPSLYTDMYEVNGGTKPPRRAEQKFLALDFATSEEALDLVLDLVLDPVLTLTLTYPPPLQISWPVGVPGKG
jgi:hypothetical protein